MSLRKIIGPGIVASRMETVSNLPIWLVVGKVNAQLLKNPIKLDGSIEVYADFPLAPTLLQRVKDMYFDEGWTSITHEYRASIGGFPGITVVTFTP